MDRLEINQLCEFTRLAVMNLPKRRRKARLKQSECDKQGTLLKF